MLGWTHAPRRGYAAIEKESVLLERECGRSASLELAKRRCMPGQLGNIGLKVGESKSRPRTKDQAVALRPLSRKLPEGAILI